MRPTVVFRYTGFTLLVNAGFMFLSLLLAIFYQDSGFYPLLSSMLITALIGLFPLIFVPASSRISNNEGYAIVVFSWLAVCFFGMLPYIMWGGEFNFSKAWFESVSGFTTTGATILNDIEALPKSMLMWRSFTHWFGGIGVVVFALVILPSMGKAQMTLSRSEVSPMARQDFHSRSRKMLRIMATTYLSITFVVTVGLVAVGLPLFDSFNLACATVATGGFAVTNMSVATYNNVGADVVIMIGMYASSIHFGLLFGLFVGRFKPFFHSAIIRGYTLMIICAITLVTLSNFFGSMYDSIWTSLRYSSFEVLSELTTTGFATANTAVWPSFAQLILIMVTFSCGCTGSTSGGVKFDRILILLSSIRTSIKQLQHPHAIIKTHVGRLSIDQSTVSATLQFILIYFCTILAGTFLLAMAGADMSLAFNANLACIGNVGPILNAVSTFGSYSMLPPFSLLVLTAVMLLGRLEILGLILIFYKNTWK